MLALQAGRSEESARPDAGGAHTAHPQEDGVVTGLRLWWGPGALWLCHVDGDVFLGIGVGFELQPVIFPRWAWRQLTAGPYRYEGQLTGPGL